MPPEAAINSVRARLLPFPLSLLAVIETCLEHECLVVLLVPRAIQQGDRARCALLVEKTDGVLISSQFLPLLELVPLGRVVVGFASKVKNELKIDCFIRNSCDVNETAAIVLGTKRGGGKSAVFILGGGSPKNFLLQTEPQIQEVLGIDEKGHDYFLQITDARPDTGGLSGATPGEAVSWGKIDPDRLPDAVVCYVDSTIALPLISAYALSKHPMRAVKRLYERRAALLEALKSEHAQARPHDEA
jgi:Deoxyhypusine synthase